METEKMFSVVCYQTTFGSGIVRDVIHAHVTRDQAKHLLKKLDIKLESEDWAIEEELPDDANETQNNH
jgi:hypothetical protein